MYVITALSLTLVSNGLDNRFCDLVKQYFVVSQAQSLLSNLH